MTTAAKHAPEEEALQRLRVRVVQNTLTQKDREWLVNFIDAALRKDEGQDAFDVFCARAAGGHLSAACDDLSARNLELVAALEGLLNALPSATTHPAIKAARAAIAAASPVSPT